MRSKGADDKEIQDALAELKKRLNDYLNEMQKNAAEGQSFGGRPAAETIRCRSLGQQDLDQMMKDLEKSARQGSREEAERMLSELRELMDRLQANNTPEARAAAAARAADDEEAQRARSISRGRQQQLMDDTFGEQRQPGRPAAARWFARRSQRPRYAEGWQGPAGPKSAEAARTAWTPTSKAAASRAKASKAPKAIASDVSSAARATSRIGRRSYATSSNKLKKDLEQMGAGDPDKLGNAEDAMGKAEDALKQNDLDEAANQQGQALEQMRQSAQQMAEQMQKNAQQRLGPRWQFSARSARAAATCARSGPRYVSQGARRDRCAAGARNSRRAAQAFRR